MKRSLWQKLKLVRALVAIGIVLMLPYGIAWILDGDTDISLPLGSVGLLTEVGAAFWASKLLHCPYCGKRLLHSEAQFYTWCGKEIDYDTK